MTDPSNSRESPQLRGGFDANLELPLADAY